MSNPIALDESYKDQPLDKVRQLIVDRLIALKLTYKDLSRIIGKNGSYVHQFVKRGTPRVLPEAVRLAIAEAIGVHPDTLRHETSPTLTVRVSALNRAPNLNRGAPPGPLQTTSPNTIPVYVPQQPLDPVLAQDWTDRPVEIGSSSGAFGVWADEDNGRMMAGDIMFVHPTRPCRDGDTVVAVEGNRVTRWGQLAHNKAGARTVGGNTIREGEVQLMKVVTVRLR